MNAPVDLELLNAPLQFSSGVVLTYSFQTDPFYYHSKSENNLTFACDYNAPVGEVNLQFPDGGCTPFSEFIAITGSSSSITEILVADIYPIVSGENLYFDIYTVRLLPSSVSNSGETYSLILSQTAAFNLESHSGQALSLSFIIPSIYFLQSSSYFGEESQLNLSVSSSLTLNSHSGEFEYIHENEISVIPNQSFTFFSGTNSHTETSSCITLGSQVNSSGGINAGLTFKNLVDSFIKFSFKRNRASSWYDDDFSDADLSFFIFPGYTTTDIFWKTGLGNYGSPRIFPSAGSPVNPQMLCLSFRYSESKPIRIIWASSSTTIVTDNLSVVSNFTVNELTGVSDISVEVLSSGVSTTVNVYGSGLLRQTGIFSNMTNIFSHSRGTNSNVFLTHYHNYVSNSDETLCDIKLTSSNGFILTPFVEISSNSYNGESGNATLSSELRFPFDMFEGSSSNITFNTSPSFSLGLIEYQTGTRMDISLFFLERYNSYNGEFSYFDIAVPVLVSVNLDPILYAGTSELLELRTQSLIQTTFYSGSDGIFNFVINGPVLFDSFISQSGEYSLIEYRTEVSLDLIQYSGEYSPLSLNTHESSGIGILDSKDGSNGYLYLSTTNTLTLVSWSDENLFINFTTRPQIEFVFNHYDGKSLSFVNLSTATQIPSIAYSGWYSTISLNTSPSTGIQLTGWAGESWYSALQSSFQIPLKSAYNGESSSISSLVYDPDYISKSGEYSLFSIATEISLNTQGYSGEVLRLEVDNHPPFSLGSLLISDGETLITSLEALRTVTFRVFYHNTIATQIDMGSATYFDLTSDKCCGERSKSASINIEMSYEPPPEAGGSGNTVIFDFILATRPRFSLFAYSGVTSSLVDSSQYLSFDFSDTGDTSEIRFDSMDYRHRLCKGYFIPNGNWLVVELNEIIDESCKANKSYTGETLEVLLSLNQSADLVQSVSGEILSFDMVTYDPWRLIAWTGELPHIDFPLEAKHTHRTGQYSSFKFYEPDMVGYTGQSSDITELVTDYSVMFLEEGCLDNEFVYQNEDGDMIPELFNSVPVEGDPYKHSIKSKCM